jgi:hypothetical protein
MTAFPYLLALTSIAILIGWLAAEVRGTRPLRILLGLLSIAVGVLWTYRVGVPLERLSYNSSYGLATQSLIDGSLKQIEDGHLDLVLTVWRGLRMQYRPTYENRAHYDELVEEAVARIRGDTPIEAGSKWDAGVIVPETWTGHWEDETGFWLVINGHAPPYSIVRSGDPTPLQFVSISPDARVLKFRETTRWQHTFTLKNKYEASHEWLNLSAQTVWRTEPIFKLIRATAQQKRFTEQEK